MPDKGQQDRSLGQRVVKEAVGVGMESPMRDSILEAVEESEGGPVKRRRQLPFAGALLGLGAAFGYLLGTRSETVLEGEGSVTESLEEPEIVETAEEAAEEMTEAESEMTEETGGSRLPRIALVLGLGAAVALLRRRLQSGEEEEWEPIEEFKTATEDVSEGVEEVAEGVTEAEEGEESEAEEGEESEAEDEESEEEEEE